MAILYGDGKAGQFAKRKATDYFIVTMLWSLGGACLCGIVLGFMMTTELGRWFGLFHWATENEWWFVLVAVVLAGVSLGALRWLDIYMNKLARERIKWLRGGQGEGLVAWYLNALPNSWHVFHNIELPNGGDLDHVLVGPAGIFCISTKSNRGLYSVRSDGTYLLNGQETKHIQQSQSLALKLKDQLERIASPTPWIQPVLIAPFAYIDFNTYQNKAWVLYEGNLCCVFLDASTKLKAADVERYAEAIASLSVDTTTLSNKG
jgi:hypothetical protein